MLPDWVSNPGPLTYESGALPIALRGPAIKLYRQIVGIPMGTNCAPLIADLFLFCYERDFMASLSYNKEAEIIQAFKSR